MSLRRLLGLAVLPWLAAAAAEPTATVTLRPAAPGPALPAGFTGLSFEVRLVMPNAEGRRYFSPDNRPLIGLFRSLGVCSLRIGGNTSDRDARELPTERDLDELFGFARAAGAKVIYCLRLRDGDPGRDADTARYLMERYGSLVDCFSIGQEPSAYPVAKRDDRPAADRMGGAAEKFPYEAYRDEWARFEAAIAAAAPDVRLAGPGVHNNGAWGRRFIADFASGHRVALITEHLYPGGAGGKVPSPEIGRDRMLGDDFVRAYQKLYDGFVPAAAAAGLPYRLEEVNNYFNGGAASVSDTFAAALWGLDFMYWWAEHGAAGINFHSGDKVAAGATVLASKYTAFASVEGGYAVRPLGYGIKAFALAGPGRLVPADVSFGADRLNLSAYAVGAADGALTVTVINKEHGPAGRAARVSLAGDGRRAEIACLAAPGHDAAATSGITLGGGALGKDGSWNGSWSALPAPGPDGTVAFTLPPATAAVIRFAAR